LIARPAIACALVAAAALASVATVQLTHPTPAQTHDEFSYLLTADTLLHGRLANPTHPLWIHFESPHILQRPTYVSKYPPLQGAILAVGLALGNPVFGTALSFALACAACTWMLRAWLPSGWALFGGLLLALHPQLAAAWGTWLWGGAAAMTGGALVYGAVPRIVRAARVRDGVWLGLGVGTLALSRPYEGAVACVPAGLFLARGLLRADARPSRASLRRAVAAAALVVAAFGGFLALYNERTTGSPWTLAYTLYDATYAAVPALIVLPPYESRSYNHAVLASFYGPRSHNAQYYWRRASVAGFLTGVRQKIRAYGRFFCLTNLGLALLALPWIWREPGVRFAVASCALFAAALAIETHEFGHYAAPFVALTSFLFVAALRRVCAVPRVGVALVSILLAAAFLEHVAMAEWRIARREHNPLFLRPRLVRELDARGGRHLVVVRYAPDHDAHQEWVYNGADIDGSAVVWAREMDPQHNRRLFAYFADREAWLLRADERPIALVPYPVSPSP